MTNPDSQLPVAAPCLAIEVDAASRLGFVSARHAVSVLRALTLRHEGPTALAGIDLHLWSEPAVLRPRVWRIDTIGPGELLEIADLAVSIDSVPLATLEAATPAMLRLEARKGGQVLGRAAHELTLLSRDEWGGLGEMAHLLPAFVRPDPALAVGLADEATALLEQAGRGVPDGYRSGDPGRAWMQAAAVWSALAGWGLRGAVAAGHVAARGQPLRATATIREDALATPLEAALLFAAGAEALGLHPVVAFAQGRIWCGVWLLPRDFGRVVEPDAVVLRKAVAAREFLPLDPERLLGPKSGFEAAIAAGRALADPAQEQGFLAAIDVAAARQAGITPLEDTRLATASGPSPVAAALPEGPTAADLPLDDIEPAPTTPEGRIERWQRRLLDLSLRNRLLNFRDGRGAVPLLCADMAALEDRLAGGAWAVPVALEGADSLSGDELAHRAAQAQERGRLAAPLAEAELQARLIALHRRARSDMQEGGTNTLFLAAGFLRWCRPGETRAYRAPLLLIPARLERRSASSAFRIGHLEDEVRINATLLEFLRRDFALSVPGLDGELPRDGSGIDLARIFDLVRLAVRDMPGFEVIEELSLSTFSFAKFLMWEDLVAREAELRDSPLVRHLLDGPETAYPQPDLPAIGPRDLDRALAPADLVTSLPADSSQLAAVAAAAQGRDFVLIGPPGTGKSQTIANIIAQVMAQGRTVLFVAEKAAALEVVHRRLAACGLGDACLELHSNKTDRASVLAQLGRGWDRAAAGDEAEWVEVTEDLRLTRDQLNAYVAALHRKGRQGFSVFDAIGRVAAGEPDFRLVFPGPDAHDFASYARLRDMAGDLERLAEVAGRDAPVDLLAGAEWSFDWQERFLAAAATLGRAARGQNRALGGLCDRLGLAPEAARMTARCKLLMGLVPLAAEDAPDLSRLPDLPLAELERAVEARREAEAEMASARGRLAADYPEDVDTRIDVSALDAEWRAAEAGIWPLSALARRRVRSVLQSHARSGTVDPGGDLDALHWLARARRTRDASPLAQLPGDRLDEMVAARRALETALAGLAGEGVEPARLGAVRAELTQPGAGPLRAGLKALAEADKEMTTAREAFESLGGRVPDDAAPADLAKALEALESRAASLADWTRWVALRHKAEVAGLGPLIVAIKAGRLDRPARAAFEAAYAAWWLPRAMDADPLLRDFAHWAQDDLVARFRMLDARAAALASNEVLRRIGGGLPARDAVPRASELGVLRHQLGLKRPSMPIRQLLGQMPESLPRLAPCVLMSPLSVAQYLPAGQPAFDVVIFDEASQITTWDAIGAIARGRQAIVVGDPKQLPPTNFFGRAEEEDEEEDVALKDMPSILDEVAASGVPVRRLDWHYRSRDEALIAFSNHFYYDGGLVTFPSPGGAGDALRLHRVDGRYGRGRGRSNAEEARAVTAMLRARLAAELERPEAARRSFGVITFNGDQQALILDHLDALRRDAPELEWFFDEAREEPVIVKNLENIQGDERDVMLFSVTFGPDLAGKLSMNFGALNAEGGERRLNVAITRARRELHVFASLGAGDIDLGRSRARGVADLKAFLDYAERGAVALPARDEGSLGPAENPFEEAVARSLEARGWEVRTQIGVSGFRIDLAVVHPDRGGAYLAGIECDGASYHSAATARDRDRIRQSVLEGLGWRIERVWSTDWFRAPAHVADRIDGRLRHMLAADRAQAETARPRRLALPTLQA
ncbi:very-short-patch-repair endonuclease [Limimaricola variabilis]|uniref:Very-short-patch-repair endonuclease n=1 Tax=Limimaricola variabilis TaxID=1492771 RepID=A0ABR6HSI2_9RHOB|nr:DUF4011 domain-containing protein [Limimaricola variabilis]MBB3713507.1 very-short-patch-repair endonuclease [Limimaricola variabilis]